MNCEIIATGSAGNGVLLNDHILIDCGIPYRAIRRLRDQLKLILLTHIHGDHFKKSTVGRLAHERPGLRFGGGEWMKQPLLDCGVSPRCIDPYQPDKVYDYGAFSVSPFTLYHDVPNCGYRIFAGKEKAVYITDTATLDGIEAPEYDLYLVEANYNEDEIKERIKRKQRNHEYAYEKEAVKRHLSERQCNNWLYENMGRSSEYIYLHRHMERDGENE